MIKKTKAKGLVIRACCIIVGLLVMGMLTSDLYHVVCLRAALSLEVAPAVQGVQAQVVFEPLKQTWVYSDEKEFYDWTEAVLRGQVCSPVLPLQPAHAVYVVSNYPFFGFDYRVGRVNSWSPYVRADYWSSEGKWKALGILDGSRPKGEGSGQRDGEIRWAIPGDWSWARVDKHEGYVARLYPTGNLHPDTCGFAALLSTVPQDNYNAEWVVTRKERVSACDNRPGLKVIYVTVLDEKGRPLRGAKVRFETAPSEGIAYDHMNIWGLTDENGYLEWNHLGVPTQYALFMGDDEVPLVENIRTDLGNEYCRPPGSSWWSGNVPVNRPGIYSYRIGVQKKGKE